MWIPSSAVFGIWGGGDEGRGCHKGCVRVPGGTSRCTHRFEFPRRSCPHCVSTDSGKWVRVEHLYLCPGVLLLPSAFTGNLSQDREAWKLLTSTNVGQNPPPK